MSTYDMFVVVPADQFDPDFIEGPSEYDLYEEADFSSAFGSEGYVKYRDKMDTVAKRVETVESFRDIIGKELCTVDENGILTFVPNAEIIYAEKKIKEIKELLEGMTPEEYLDLGEYKLRTAIHSDSVYVHTYGDDASDCFTQSIDRFMTDTLTGCRKYGKNDKDKQEFDRVVIPMIIGCKA